MQQLIFGADYYALRRFPTDKSVSYNDVVNRVYSALYELNLECDILYDREPDWSPYRLLIFPQFYCCPDSTIARVRAFAAEGGTVLATFRSFFADENLQIRHDRQPHGLTDVFGMHYSRFTKDAAHDWMELLIPDAAETIAGYGNRYWKRYASITRNVFGKGAAWYLGVMPESDTLKSCLLGACADAGIIAPAEVWPVVRRGAVSADGNALCFLMNYSSEQKTIPCPVSGLDLLTGMRYEAGAELALPDWGAVILRT